MPEAAEVTVAARQLGHVCVGRTLDTLRVTHPRSTRAQPAADLDAFVGHRVTSVASHGKWIVATFSGVDLRLGIHLRMSGQLLARPAGATVPDRHVHGVFGLGTRQETLHGIDGVPPPPTGGAGLDDTPFDVWFRDPRTFGELRVLPRRIPVAADLGDPAVTASVLAAAARRRRVGVKAVLLDQARTVSGIGSYLADEALHRAGISPVRPADSVAVTAWERILDGARLVASESSRLGGVTLPDEGWVDLWGRPGRYAAELRVHGRTECGTCDGPLRSAVVGGRSARWCPRCQDARRRR